MSINAVTSNPYAYLERALPNDPVARYVPEEKMGADGKKVAEDDGFGEDGFGFGDFLDIINPLQHIPGISSLYREITGDEISPGARMIGGTIYGGSIGLALSFINSTIEEATGKDIGGTVIGFFSSGDDAPPEQAIAAVPAAEEFASVPVLAEEVGPAALPEVTAVPLATAPEPAPAVVTTAEAPALTPIGLEWKGAKPNFLQNIEKAKAIQTQDLTEEQLSAVFKSFRLAPPAKPVAAPEASAAYQKTAVAMESIRPAPSDYTDYNRTPAR
ncbi:MAG: hypothetical protein K9G33_02930 [Sneathiella sp.]|nr:hypothetical protein [Sneathiella sp.]